MRLEWVTHHGSVSNLSPNAFFICRLRRAQVLGWNFGQSAPLSTLLTELLIKEISEGPYGRNTYYGYMESGRIVWNLEQIKTWPNIPFFHLWSGFPDGHRAVSLWGVRGTCGYPACVWHVINTWQSFLTKIPEMDPWCLLNIWIQRLQSRRRHLQTGFKLPFLILFGPHYLQASSFSPPNKNYPPDSKPLRWFFS